MRVKSEVFFVLFLAVFTISCNVGNKKKVDSQEIEVNKEEPKKLTNLEVEITGMTCEIGCAKLIQSKLYKVDGIKFAQVSFADSLGNITYDANSITTDEIKNMIQKIAGGDLYEVTAMNEVVTFKEINK